MSVGTDVRRKALPGGKWVQPIQGVGISTAYGIKGPMWSSGAHTGADFAAPEGTPVHAVAAGRVGSIGASGAYGNRVVIVHAPGFETWYCHLSKFAVSVATGQISAGTVIGEVGSTGNVTGPHLHLEVRRNGMHTNPAPYLSGAVDAPSSTSYDTGAQYLGQVTNPALQASGNSGIVGTVAAEIRRFVIVAAIVLGGTALVAVGVAQGSQPLRKKAS